MLHRPCHLLALISLLITSLALPAAADQLPIIVNEPKEDNPPREWNSHIDNEAYLKRLRRQRQEQVTTPPSVIHVERSRHGSWPGKHAPSSGMESWEVEYHTPGYSLIYRERYRPNDLPHTIILPVKRKHTPHPEPYHNGPMKRRKPR